MRFKKTIILFLGILVEFLLHFQLSKTGLITNNYGVSLSVNWLNPLFLNIIFVLIIGWFYFKNKSYFLVLVLVGGIVNMIDRLSFGYVRDYWNFTKVMVNNLNDWLICLGVLLFLLEDLWKRQK